MVIYKVKMYTLPEGWLGTFLRKIRYIIDHTCFSFDGHLQGNDVYPTRGVVRSILRKSKYNFQTFSVILTSAQASTIFFLYYSELNYEDKAVKRKYLVLQ